MRPARSSVRTAGWLAAGAITGIVGVGFLAFRGSLRVDGESAVEPGAPSRDSRSPGAGPEFALEAVPDAEAKVANATPRELPEGNWVRGRVIVPSGTPEDERIEIAARVLSFDDSPGYVAQIEGDGKFAVMFPKDVDSGWIEVHARYLVLEPNYQVDLETPPEEIVIEPVLGGRVRGRLVAPGRPEAELRALAGTCVEISAGPREASRRFYPRRTCVGEDLKFEFPALPPTSEYEIAVKAKELLPFERVFEIPAGTITDVEIELHAGARISGRVLDAVGKPIERAKLWRTETPPRRPRRQDDEDAVTGANGEFAMTAIPPGDVTILIQAYGCLPETLELGRLAEGSVRDGLEARMRTSLVHGRVEWRDGTPANDAVVEVGATMETRMGVGSPMSGFAFYPVQTEVSDGGRFELDANAEGPFCVVAHSPRIRELDPEDPSAAGQSGVARLEGVRPSADPIVLVLEPTRIVRGRVIDDLGRTITSFHVEGHQDLRSAWFSHWTQVSGQFDHPDGAFAFAGLGDGSWVFRANVDRRWSRDCAVELADQAAPILLVIPRSTNVAGVVVDPDGRLVSLARIHSASSIATISDENGGFEIQELPAGRLEFWADARTFAPSEVVRLRAEAGSSLTGLRLVLRRSGTIVCDVLDGNGDPEPHRRVEVQTPDGSSPVDGDSDEGPGEETDEAGRIVIEDLAPGLYMLSKEQVQGARAGRSRVSAEVVEGEVTRVVLGGPKGSPIRARGRVTDGEAPVKGVDIVTWLEDADLADSELRTDADGRFELLLPEPAEFRFSFEIEDRGRRSLTTWRMVAGPSPVDLDFVLPRGRISGVVRSSDDRPLDEIEVSLTSVQAITSLGGWTVDGWAVSSRDGCFTFPNMPGGRYELGAFLDGPRAEDGSTAEVTLEEGGHLDGVVLRLP